MYKCTAVLGGAPDDNAVIRTVTLLSCDIDHE